MAVRRTQYLVIKPLAAGGYGYYWQPSPALTRAGWKGLNLGTSASNSDPAKFEAAELRNAEVAAWRGGGVTPRTVKVFVRRHTFAEAIAGYKAHVDARVEEGKKPPAQRNPLVGKAMSVNTRATYFSSLVHILEWGTSRAAARRDPRAGDELVAGITHDNVLRFRDALMKPDASGYIAWTRAHSTLRVLRSWLAWCEAEKIIPKGSNPAAKFELDTPPSRSKIWDEGGGTGDFDAFLAACAHLKCPSVGLFVEVASWSAQRRGDLLRLNARQWGRINLADQRLVDQLRGDDPDLKGFTIVQGKTGQPLTIPIVQPIRARIEATIAANLARDVSQFALFIREETGRPWTRDAISQRVREVLTFCAAPPPDAIAKGFIPRPEMTELRLMDLRRTRVCFLHDRGIDPLGISMITGHSAKTVDDILATTYRPRNPRGAAITILCAHGPTARRQDDEQEKQA